MPPSSSTFLLFLSAAFLICITPGPDMLYVIANGIQRGVRGGVVAAFGMAAGMLVHTVLVVTGLSLLLTSSPSLFVGVRLVGAGYLLWIAAQTLLARNEQLALDGAAQRSMFDVFRQAVITNVLNPKVAIFFLAFLPQFVPHGSSHPQADLFALGVAFLIIGFVVDAMVGAASGRVREVLADKTSLTTVLNTVSGLVFGLLAILQLGHLAVEQLYEK